MRKLAVLIREIKADPKIFICGMKADKDYETAVGMISRYIDRAICIDGFIPNSVNAKALADLFESAVVGKIPTALGDAVRLAGKHGAVIIGGSLYLASFLQKYTNSSI
jgi:folylpolyglutamate synthase/dihydropteroate synthase